MEVVPNRDTALLLLMSIIAAAVGLIRRRNPAQLEPGDHAGIISASQVKALPQIDGTKPPENH
jgi:hypothetical protein